jgi:drug/metabolite transporter (DMT)-like permease
MTSHAIRQPASLTGARSDDATRSAGSLAVAVAAVAFSTAGLFTRLIAADVWTMLFWRGLFGGLLIAAYIAWQERARTRAAFAAVGWAGLLTASCSTVATICFITALRETTVADVTIIYATAPFIAAVIAWAWTREYPPRTTLVASGVALIGVVVMFGGPLSKGHARGNLLALAMTGLMALMMVVIRKNRQVSMLPATCLSAFACAVAVFPLSHPMAVTRGDLLLLALFGTLQFGTGLLLLTVGSRLISATRSSLLANLELPFAPLWVWLAFNEIPSLLTCVGGGIVLVAVLTDAAADQRRARRRRHGGRLGVSEPTSVRTVGG